MRLFNQYWSLRVWIALQAWALFGGVYSSPAAASSQYALSSQAYCLPDGAVQVWWNREAGPPWMVGWYVERITADGMPVRIPGAFIRPDLFDAPSSNYRMTDLTVKAVPGDQITYRLIIVDAELREIAGVPVKVMVTPDDREKDASGSTLIKAQSFFPASEASPGGNRIRMDIMNDGLYRIDSSAIASLLDGFSQLEIESAIVSGALALSCNGNPVAWAAGAGGCSILFFGQTYRDNYSDRNVYWIDPFPGIRLVADDRSTTDRDMEGWYWRTKRIEQNLHFMPYIPGDVDDDFWVWTGKQLTTPESSWAWTIDVSLENLHPTVSTGIVAVGLIGAYDGPADLDNHTLVRANGVLIDSRKWPGNSRLMQTAAVSGLAGEGLSVAVEVRRETGVSTTMVLIDAIEVTYASRLRATDDCLIFTAPSGLSVISVDGFSSPDIFVFDVSDPLLPVWIHGSVDYDGNSWRVSWLADPDEPAQYMATARILAPARIESVADSGWGAAQEGATHVVIAPRVMLQEAAVLVSHRSAQGLPSVLVPVEDLFDEFAFGQRHPIAIRRFLSQAVVNWALPPFYVCLAGDGHLDFHDIYQQAETRPNHITPFIDRIPYATPSGGTLVTLGVDQPMVDLDEDGVPLLRIGRLPAQTPSALAGMINRIIIHESVDDWKDRVLLIGDKDANHVFNEALDRLQNRIPSDMTVSRERHTLSTPADAMRQRVINAINAGPLVAVYYGHANNVGISSPYFFEHSYVRSYMPEIVNGVQTTLFLAGTCMLNNFSQPHPNNRCLGKGFLDAASGGPVAVWASAAEATLAMAEATTGAIVDQLFRRHGERLGDLIWPALSIQAASASPWTVRASVLLGDPGTRIRTRFYEPSSGWDSGYIELGGSWRRLNWYGDYVPVGNGWFWNPVHGYFYPASGGSPSSVFWYTMDMGWLFTRQDRFPYLYRFNDQSWLWYFPGSSGPRWFYNLRTGEWENRP